MEDEMDDKKMDKCEMPMMDGETCHTHSKEGDMNTSQGKKPMGGMEDD